MADMTIQEFCKRHGACQEVREWALANCQSMREVWDTAKPQWMVWVATRRGVLTERDLRVFCVRCARSVEHLMTDQWSRHAIAVDERFVLGNADADELAAAHAAALAAAADWAADWAAMTTEAAREQQAQWVRERTPRFDREEVPAAAAAGE